MTTKTKEGRTFKWRRNTEFECHGYPTDDPDLFTFSVCKVDIQEFKPPLNVKVRVCEDGSLFVNIGVNAHKKKLKKTGLFDEIMDFVQGWTKNMYENEPTNPDKGWTS